VLADEVHAPWGADDVDFSSPAETVDELRLG
jgi:hypothetical protein